MSIEGNVENNQAIYKLTGKITAIPGTDDTLTKEGQAADARKTGEELARIEAKIDGFIATLGNEEL